MKILLIEDEAPAARRLQQLLTQLNPHMEVLSVLESIKASLQWFAAHPQPELIFMDVHLSDGLCFEIFRKTTVDSPVIFTTAYDQYALQAFKVNSIDYLLKPVTQKDLSLALEKHRKLQKHTAPIQVSEAETLIRNLLEQKTGFRTRFLIEHRDAFVKLETKDIAYFYLDEKLAHAVTFEKKVWVIDLTMEELENQLDPQTFLRISRQMIVNAQSVTAIHKYFNGKLKVTLKPDTMPETIISREKSMRFKEWLATSK